MTAPDLEALEAIDCEWTRARIADLKADVAAGCAGVVAEEIAMDLLDVHACRYTRDDAWALIDQVMR